jgi:UDP-glucose 4-epimerase
MSRATPAENVVFRVISDLHAEDELQRALSGVDYVVHLAARVHVMNETAADPTAAFRSTNVEGTKRLASLSAAAGVKRFIYMSSIKVLGERTVDRPFMHGDPPSPSDPYSVSKHEAEIALRSIGRATGMEVVILRPPMIYGPGVGGNMRRLMELVSSGIPLPFGAIRNRRTMIALPNLCDVIAVSLRHPEAAGECFLVADDTSLSTPELITAIADSMGKLARLVSVPVPLLDWVGRLTGRRAEVRRLCESLEIDTSHTRRRLGWWPRVSPVEGVQLTVDDYLTMKNAP